MVLCKIIHVKADLNFQLLSLKILLYDCSRLVIGPNLSFDHRSHWVLPDGFRKMLLKIIEYEKNEFKSENGWKFRSALTCNLKAQFTATNATYWNFIFANKIITINNIPSRTSPNFACGTIFVSLCIELKIHWINLFIYFK